LYTFVQARHYFIFHSDITMNRIFATGRRRVLVGTFPLILSACAAPNPDQAYDTLRQFTEQHTGQTLRWQRNAQERDDAAQQVRKILQEELHADSAVQLALLNNQSLQARLYELAIAEADYAQAAHIANPGFSFSRLHGGTQVEFDRSLSLNLLQLLSFPLTREMEAQAKEQTRLEVANDILKLVADTRVAYYTALAAQQSLQYAQQIQDVAEAAADLASRMRMAGNFSELQQAQQQIFYADATLNRLHAQQQLVRSREALTRLLGLSDAEGSYRLPDRLPDMPTAIIPMPAMEQQAITQRLDVQMAGLHSAHLAKNLGLVQSTRWINVFELSGVNNTLDDHSRQYGYQVTLELPLFDWGEARVAKAEARYMQALRNTASIGLHARSEVREMYAMLQSKHAAVMEFRNQILPLKKKIAEQQLLHYNGMLVSVFDLLADARGQMLSVNEAISAERDFWIAQSNLQMSMLGSVTRKKLAEDDKA
jgi:outer membrane protein TolC